VDAGDGEQDGRIALVRHQDCCRKGDLRYSTKLITCKMINATKEDRPKVFDDAIIIRLT